LALVAGYPTSVCGRWQFDGATARNSDHARDVKNAKQRAIRKHVSDHDEQFVK
jgi:hypothetical protein